MHYKHFKPILDFFIALILIFLTLPIIIILSILIFLDTKRFPIFKQQRSLSLSHKPIFIYKFVTLRTLNPNLQYTESQILSHKYLDDQVTKIGKFLRSTGLDELPQLINVIKGEMSLIGPRPLTLTDLVNLQKYYPDVHLTRSILKSKPGIIGLWQLNRINEFDVMLLRFYDDLYEKSISFKLDTYLFFKAILTSISGKHRDSITI